jgi:LacI family transcriptional regulator
MLDRHDDTPFASGVFIERRKGFRRAVEAAGETFSEDRVLSVEFSRGGGRDALRNILERTAPPVSVFASCDLVAHGVMDEAADRGLELGRHVRLVGFDDQPWTEEAGLSTVHQPIEHMGALAARLLLRRLEDPSSELIHEEVVPRLIRRGSS